MTLHTKSPITHDISEPDWITMVNHESFRGTGFIKAPIYSTFWVKNDDGGVGDTEVYAKTIHSVI